MQTATQVLIVGAGPTGLMAACQLARHGVDFLLVDRKARASVHSKALGVQARTLELFEQMDLAERTVEEGAPTRYVIPRAGGRELLRLNIGDIGKGLSPFPFLLILPQSRTERLLIDFLEERGHSVHWNTELIDFEQEPEGVTARLRTAEGTKTVRADWLVGADGASSTVRQSLGLSFEGGTYAHTFLLADVRVEGLPPPKGIRIGLEGENFVAFFPMKGAGRYRLISTVPAEVRDRDEDLRFEEVRSVLERRSGEGVRVAACRWFSVYRLHRRRAGRFRKGRCFLAGDAAHVHSPAGAQGMNTGIQDASNLAWKLARVAQGQAGEGLLDSYEVERLPVARRLIRTTDRAFRMAISPHPLAQRFRKHVVPYLLWAALRLPPVRRFVFRAVSQIGISYAGGPLARGHGFRSGSPRAGDRAPFAEVQAEGWTRTGSIFQLFAGTAFHLLLFPVGRAVGRKALERATAAFNDDFALHIIPERPENQTAYASYGVKRPTLFLIRPDGHIGLRSTPPDPVELVAYLEEAMRLGRL